MNKIKIPCAECGQTIEVVEFRQRYCKKCLKLRNGGMFRNKKKRGALN